MSYNPFSKENRKIVLLNLLSTAIWYSFAYIAKILLETIMVYTMPTYIIHIGFVLIIVALNVWLSLFLKQRRKKPIKEHPVLNNPDLFPSLNETALKKHISIKVDECPYSGIIKRITLYQVGKGVKA